METVVYLIRHSVRFNNNTMIESYRTDQEYLIKNEKIILSVNGEKRAEILSNEKELQDMDVVYTSNCVRTLQTAKYLLDKQNLKVNIDDRFDERKTGLKENEKIPFLFKKQCEDPMFKAPNGESQLDVRKRMYEALMEVISNNKGKRIAIFSHAYAMMFLLLKWCELIEVRNDQELAFCFKDKVVFDKGINSPDVFKLIFNEECELISIENIIFDDLEYDDFDI